MYIYADILIITNMYVDYLLIRSTAAITHTRIKNSRGLAAAFTGGLLSLVILLPRLNFIIMLMIKVLSAGIISAIAFGIKCRRKFIVRSLILFLVSFIFSGACYFISSIFSSNFIITRNGTVYADFSLATLIFSTIFAFAAIKIYQIVTGVNSSSHIKYTIILQNKNKTISLQAAADTGNVLRDSFTGKSVIIISRTDAEKIFDDIPPSDLCDTEIKYISGWRYIPYATIGGGGLIPIIRPDSVYVKNNENGDLYSVDVYIGVSDKLSDYAIFNPCVLI
ncbi:MAG: sigma-E processing peptidase SpoIIGA [Huintestinicola sp.]